MLIILPPSESKRPPADQGDPIDLEGLSFPTLTATRRRVLGALVATSGAPDAFARLGVRPTMAAEVARNTWLPDQPTRPVLDVYAGPLHAGLDATSLSPAGLARASRGVIVTSAVFGALRPTDRIPSYRCHICAHLVGLDRLEPTWRAVLPGALAEAAGSRGVVLDLRSPTYQAAGMPTGIGERTVTMRVYRHDDEGRRIGDVVAKRVRGEVARALLESDVDPADPEGLVDVLGDRWPVRLEPGTTRDGSWTVALRATSGSAGGDG